MEADHTIRISLVVAKQTLELISALDKPLEFAKLLRDNTKSETKERDNGAIKKFLEEPHILCSGFDAEFFFMRDNSWEEMLPYLKHMAQYGIQVTGDEEDLTETIASMNQRLGVKITSERFKRFVIPGLILVKIALRIDMPYLETKTSNVMANAPSNTFTKEIFQEQLFLIDGPTLNRYTARESVIQNSFITAAFYFTLCILACASDNLNEPPIGLGRDSDFFLSAQMIWKTVGGLSSVLYTKIPLAHMEVTVFLSDRNEFDLSTMIKEYLLEPSRLVCVDLFETLSKYIPYLISRRSPGPDRLVTGELTGLDRLLVHLKNTCPLGAKLMKNGIFGAQGKAKLPLDDERTNTAERQSSQNIRSSDVSATYPLSILLKQSLVRPDYRLKTGMSLKDQLISLWCFEMKLEDIWGSEMSGNITDCLCVPSGLTRYTASTFLKADAGRKGLLSCLRQMCLETMLSRSQKGILTDGKTSIMITFDHESEFQSLEHHQKLQEKTTKRQKMAGDAAHVDTEAVNFEPIVKMNNVKIDIYRRTYRTKKDGVDHKTMVSSHFGFYLAAGLLTVLPDVLVNGLFSADSAASAQLRMEDCVEEDEIVNAGNELIANSQRWSEQFLNRSFQFLIARSPESVIWIGLYCIQVEIFETLTRNLSERTKRKLTKIKDSFKTYIKGRKGLTSKLNSQFRQDAANFVKSITPKPSNVLQSPSNNSAVDVNRPTIIDRLPHLNAILKLLSDDAFDLSGHRINDRPRSRPSTAEELGELLSGLSQAEILDIRDYDIKCLLKGVRIPRCHNAEDSLSVVLDVQRTDWEGYLTGPSILKVYDSVRVRLSDESQFSITNGTGQPIQPRKVTTVLGEKHGLEGHYRSTVKEKVVSSQRPDGEGHMDDDEAAQLLEELQTFTNISLYMFDTYYREVIALNSLKDVFNVPAMRRYGFMSVSNPAELLTVSQSENFSDLKVEGFAIEMSKVEHVIQDLAVTRVIGLHYEVCALEVSKSAFNVLKQIHDRGITHGDLHYGNVLFSCEELVNKSENDVKKILDEMKVIHDGFVQPHIIDFGSSVSLNKSILQRPEQGDHSIDASNSNSSIGDSARAPSSAQRQSKEVEQFNKEVEEDIGQMVETLVTVFFFHFSGHQLQEIKHQLESFYSKW